LDFLKHLVSLLHRIELNNRTLSQSVALIAASERRSKARSSAEATDAGLPALA
jgi:hypothetical protein